MQPPYKGSAAAKAEARSMIGKEVPNASSLLANYQRAILSSNENRKAIAQRALEAGESPEEVQRYLQGY